MENSRRVFQSRLKQTVRRFALSGDGKRVLVLPIDGKISVRDTPNGKDIVEIRTPPGVSCIGLNFGGRQAAFGYSSGKIQLRSVERPTVVGRRWVAHSGNVLRLSMTKDGTRIGSTGEGNNIRIWDTKKGKTVFSVEVELRAHDLAFSSNGQFMIYKDVSENVTIWDTCTNAIVFRSNSRHEGHTANMAPETYEHLVSAMSGCGSKPSTLWPQSLPRCYGDVFLDEDGIYHPPERSIDFLPNSSCPVPASGIDSRAVGYLPNSVLSGGVIEGGGNSAELAAHL